MDDIIVKIKKLLNTANDPNASENEVFVAVKSKELAVSRRAFNAGVIACDKYNGR